MLPPSTPPEEPELLPLLEALDPELPPLLEALDPELLPLLEALDPELLPLVLPVEVLADADAPDEELAEVEALLGWPEPLEPLTEEIVERAVPGFGPQAPRRSRASASAAPDDFRESSICAS